MKEKKEAGSWRPRSMVQPIGGNWRALQWRVLERQVVSMQKEIYQASQRGDRQSVQRVQQRVLEAEAARL